MQHKPFAFLLVLCLGATCTFAQAPSPEESPAASPAVKQRSHKKATATEFASPDESPAASVSPAKHAAKKKTGASATASPASAASASPGEKRTRKAKTTSTTSSASPAASASPGKFLGGLFKPKSSTGGGTAGSTAATGAGAGAATGAGATKSTTRATSTAEATPAPGGGHGLVWVNTESHIYHREGSRFYGTTKKGKYTTEAEAIKEGDRAAGKGE